MLSYEQWQRIREATEVVIDRQSDVNAIQTEDSLAVIVERLAGDTHSINLLLRHTGDWDLEPR